jgi:hypothetical protein
MKTVLTIPSLLLALTAAAPVTAPQPPNIIFSVADDMGYADCGVQGCRDVPTPNIDSLAKEGLRFTDAFNAVHCPLEATGESLQRFASIQDKPRRTYAGMLSSMEIRM